MVVNSGTAALHCAMAAIGASPGDEVIVPAISFVATANCVVYRGVRRFLPMSKWIPRLLTLRMLSEKLRHGLGRS